MKLDTVTRLKVALRGMAVVLRRPLYALGAVVSSLLMLGISVWAVNYELLRFVIFDTPFSLREKGEFFLEGYKVLWLNGSTYTSSTIVFAVLFGVNTALLVFVLRRRYRQRSLAVVSGGSVLVGIVSGGCAACGASVLAPLLISLGVTSIRVRENVGLGVVVLGSLALSSSIYRLAVVAASLSPKKASHC